MAKAKRERQISFKVDSEFYDYFSSVAARSDRPVGMLARLLVEWATPYYEAAGSVEGLRKLSVKAGASDDDTTRPLLHIE